MATSKRAKQLQASGWQGVFYVTGGGSQLISELLTTAGASTTVLEVGVPYAGAALTELLGGTPDQACSANTARALAMRGLQRAQALGSAKPFGLGCTAGLATDRTKRGKHRAHVAIQTLAASMDVRFDFASTRAREEAALLEGLWQTLSQGLKITLPHKAPPETSQSHTRAPLHWRKLLTGEQQAVPASTSTTGATPRLLLPGSFNPLHNGHRTMLTVAQEQLGVAGAFELSIANVDKPTLDYSSIKERAAAFRGKRTPGPLWLTTLPTFVEKSRHFPNTAFAVGIDTLVRIANPKYYGGTSQRNRALKELTALGAHFVVFGRNHGGRFQTLDQVRLPKALRLLCTGISKDQFHSDLSSTALRRQAQTTT